MKRLICTLTGCIKYLWPTEIQVEVRDTIPNINFGKG